MCALPHRPVPPRTWRERAEQWVQWVGPGRLVGSAVVVLAVLAGAYWLVRPPAASTESRLPMAQGGAAGSSGASTTAPATAPVAPSTTATQQIVVHVAGAVSEPGVYSLHPGARVVDAVRAAGGFATDADPNGVNLAALVADGQRVYITRVGEVAPAQPASAGDDTPPPPVNLNTATVDQLDELPGVGPATAAAIVAHRTQHGPFTSVEQLAEVRGIGPVKLDALRGLVTV